MKNSWLVFKHEYWQHVTRKGYLIFTFGFPIFLGGAPLLAALVISTALYFIAPTVAPEKPLGVVDQVGLLINEADQAAISSAGYLVKSNLRDIINAQDAVADLPEAEPTDDINSPIRVVFFRSPEEAAAALATEQIQAYYTLPPDYWTTGELILTYYDAPDQITQGLFRSWIQATVSREVPPDILNRYYGGPNFTTTDTTGESREFGLMTFVEGALVYLIIYFVRLVGTSFTANYLFDSISQEADDRTIEILITSVTPLQFLIGKVTGILAVGLTQLAMWSGLAVIGMFLFSLVTSINLLALLLSWPYLTILISMLLGAYVMDHLLAAALGLLKVSGGAGMQLLGVINLMVVFGLIYATYFIPRNPHSLLAVSTSLFPITSPIVLMIRLVVSQVPLWEIIAAQLILWLTNLFILLWLQRLLRANLLAYKGPFRLREWLRERWQWLLGRFTRQPDLAG